MYCQRVSLVTVRSSEVQEPPQSSTGATSPHELRWPTQMLLSRRWGLLPEKYQPGFVGCLLSDFSGRGPSSIWKLQMRRRKEYDQRTMAIVPRRRQLHVVCLVSRSDLCTFCQSRLLRPSKTTAKNIVAAHCEAARTWWDSPSAC